MQGLKLLFIFKKSNNNLLKTIWLNVVLFSLKYSERRFSSIKKITT